MGQTRKNFIPLNEGFVCEECGKEVPSARGTFRNHCPFCLTGKHVDEVVPGDRESNCGGLMRTVRYEGTDPGKLVLVQQCDLCKKISRNKIARDDDVGRLF